jgi:hypothetical protein
MKFKLGFSVKKKILLVLSTISAPAMHNNTSDQKRKSNYLSQLIKIPLIFLTSLISFSSYASECDPQTHFNSSVSERDAVHLLNSPSAFELEQFFSSDPVVYSVTGGAFRRTKQLTEVKLVICDLGGVVKKRIYISLDAPNKHLLKITPAMFDNTIGAYKLNYSARWTSTSYPDGGARPEYSYGRFTSTGQVHLYANISPTISLSPATIKVELGSPAEVTVTVNDASGKLDATPLVGVSTTSTLQSWTVTPQSCSGRTTIKQVCKYRITHPKSLWMLETFTFSANVADKLGLTARATGSVTVEEKNVAPSISVTSDKTTIGVGGNVALTATATDRNLATANKIKSIRWCYSTNGNSDTCTALVKHDTSTSDTCSVAVGGATASCIYTHIFPSAGVYSVWAEVSDGSATPTKSTLILVTVDAPPAVSFSTSDSADFTLNNTVSISATATDTNLTKLQLCYGAKNVAKTTCANEIKACTTSPCAAQLVLDTTIFNASNYDFYALAFDGINTVSQSVARNIFGTYTMAAPTVNGANNLPGTAVQVKGTYFKQGDDTNSVQLIELYDNDSFVSKQATPASPFQFAFTLADVSSHTFKFKLTDNREAVVWSAPFSYTVEVDEPKKAPTVTYLGSVPNTDGDISLSLTTVANASQFKWYEYSSCPTTEQTGMLMGTTGVSGLTLTLNKNYGGNGSYCYCAQATNANGDGPTGLGSACAAVSVAIPDDAPGQTRFSPSLSLSQNQPYELSWINNNLGDITFRLDRKLGQPGSSNVWQQLHSGNKVPILISPTSRGDVSYRVVACNRDNTCGSGQIITVNHQAPYLHSARYVAPTAGQPAEILFEGLGMQGLSTAKVQIRNSAETFTYPVYQAAGDGSTRFRLRPDPQLITGFENGGLRLRVSTRLGYATIEFNDSGSSDRAYIDLIEASPTVSAQGVVYVSSGQSIHALQNGNNLNGWPFSLPAGTPAEVKITAAPTLDKDVNANDVVYVGATNRYVYKLDYQTNIVWQTRIRGEVHAKAQLLAEPNPYQNDEIAKILYVGAVANGGNDVSGLYALNADTGAERFMYPLLTGIKQQPQIFTNGDMHVTTEDDQLHIINRQNVGPNALRWPDIDSSLIKAN